MPCAGIVRSLLWLSGTLLMVDIVIGVPVPAREKKDIVLPMPMPATRFVQVPVIVNPQQSYYQQYQQYPNPQHNLNPQTRGPFEFIGQWIQQTPWLPLQVNVPDIFQNIGNGISQASNNVQQFSQNIGNGVSQISQNVGNGFNQFTQNVGSGFNQWMQQLGQRVPFIGNIANSVGTRVPMTGNNGAQPILVMVPVEYPAGQHLVLDEALDAFP